MGFDSGAESRFSRHDRYPPPTCSWVSRLSDHRRLAVVGCKSHTFQSRGECCGLINPAPSLAHGEVDRWPSRRDGEVACLIRSPPLLILRGCPGGIPHEIAAHRTAATYARHLGDAQAEELWGI